MTRVLVTGSRTWTDLDTITRALSMIAEDYEGPFTLIDGRAPGADTLAMLAAKRMGWEIESHIAEWERYGKRAGFIRNREMVESDADVCVAFIKNGSKGATQTVMLARQAAIPVRTYEVWTD